MSKQQEFSTQLKNHMIQFCECIHLIYISICLFVDFCLTASEGDGGFWAGGRDEVVLHTTDIMPTLHLICHAVTSANIQ